MVTAQGYFHFPKHDTRCREALGSTKHGSNVRSVHGGSAANVLKGLGNLALQQRSARFMGMVGLDDAGRCKV